VPAQGDTDAAVLANRPDAATREYRISLETDFGRFNTLLRAGEVAENLGLRDEATRYYRLLLSNASDPAPESEQALKPARAFVEAR
jgi:hypothetical protein